MRNAAQHYLLDISEAQFYIQVQSGVTLFRDILVSVFDQDLSSFLPARVLPVSIEFPTDLVTLFDSEIGQIRKLLSPGRRRRIEAMARLRPLAILDAAFQGEMGHPSDEELVRLGEQLMAGQSWEVVFKGNYIPKCPRLTLNQG